MASEIEFLKGGQFPLNMDFEDLCLYPGDNLPNNFQMPNMEKYDGTGCPKMHLRMYCNAMFQWGQDDKVLVQMFPRSLEKDIAKWFVGQDKRDVGT